MKIQKQKKIIGNIMAVHTGQKTYKVISSNIDAISITGATILESGNIGPNGGYQVKVQHDLTGCGGADSGFFIKLNDSTKWTNISYEVLVLGSAACWTFNEQGFGQAADTTGQLGNGNLLQYNESLGDNVTWPSLSWEQAQFKTHNKVYACDNNVNNFFVYNTGSYRSFVMKRRRNTANSNFAGIHCGRSCSATGSGAITIIRNIRIW